MNSLLLYLQHTLDIDLDPNEPVLVVNDTLTIYFEEDNNENLLFRCLVMPLPNDIFSLKYLLQLNYGNPIQLSASVEDDQILATYYLNEEHDEKIILDRLYWFIDSLFSIQNIFSCPGNLSSEIDSLQGMIKKHKIE